MGVADVSTLGASTRSAAARSRRAVTLAFVVSLGAAGALGACANGASSGQDGGGPGTDVAFPDAGGDGSGMPDLVRVEDVPGSATPDAAGIDVPQPDLPPPPPSCGDGNTNPGEECDDGNVRSGDGCTSRCVREVPCEGGVIRDDTGACYLHVTQQATWADAERDCQSRGGHLVSLTDPGTSNIVRALVGDTVVWVGLFLPTTPGQGGAFSWIDGRSEVAGGPGWAAGQPNNATGDERCGALISGGYADDGCLNTRGYVCELRCGNGRVDPGEHCDDGNRTPGDGCSSACRREAAPCEAPAVFDPQSGHCYEAVSAPVTWTQARDDCAARGGHLVTPQNAAEQSLVEGLLASQLPGVDTWTGLVAAAPNDFGWATGEPLTWTAWDQGEPNQPGVENCGIILRAVRHEGFGRWDNRPCDQVYGYVCERE